MRLLKIANKEKENRLENMKKIVGYFNWLQWLMIIGMIATNALCGGFSDPLVAVATITGVVCVILVGKGAIGNYAFGTINALAYGVLALNAHVYGDAMENLLFFLPIQFIGYFIWKKHMNVDTKKVKAKIMNIKQLVISGIAIVVSIIGFAQVLGAMGGKVVYYDSATNVLTVFAQIAMLLCFSEQWIAWILVNIMSVVTWAILWSQGDPTAPAVTIMWGFYLLNAIYSYFNWRKLSK